MICLQIITDKLLKYGEKTSFCIPRYPPFRVTPVQLAAYTVHMGRYISEMVPALAVLWYFCSHEAQEDARSRLLEVIP